jgi:uncharacterized protein YdeI (YjbR/CyaY-like superfamily)
MARDPRVDAYIANKAAPFAQPILAYIREVFHEAVPDIVEDIKWGAPAFVYKGKNLGGMAAFKAHAALMIAYADRVGDGMGGYGKIASLDELPPKEKLIAQLKQGAAEIDAGKKPEWSKVSPPKPELSVPQDMAAALKANPPAQAVFEGFTPVQQRDYIEWITSAKQDATREKRLTQAVEWIAEGKRRNWKYEKR